MIFLLCNTRDSYMILMKKVSKTYSIYWELRNSEAVFTRQTNQR